MTRTPKIGRPETLREAQSWETVKNKYLEIGLCVRCASQAAWGHQVGFSNLEHDPCDVCAPLVAELPVLAGRNSRWWRFHEGTKGLKAVPAVVD